MLRLLIFVLQELERIANNSTVRALRAHASVFAVIVSIRQVVSSVRHGEAIFLRGRSGRNQERED
jgi:hypothetical protein